MTNPYSNNYLYPPYSSLQEHLIPNEQMPLPSSRYQTVNQNQPYQIDQNWTAQYPGSVFSQGPSNCKLAAITFDDAPDSLFAPLILDIFLHYDVKATFFSQGECAQKNPEMLQRIAKEGHIIGNHTFSHSDLTKLSPNEIRAEIARAEMVFKQITGLRTALFRPPFGFLNKESISIILSMGYKIILWNVDSFDWAGLTGPAITARVVANIVPGSIILMHNSCTGSVEAGTGTVQSLPYIIEILKTEGYSFTTIPALLNIPAYQ